MTYDAPMWVARGSLGPRKLDVPGVDARMARFLRRATAMHQEVRRWISRSGTPPCSCSAWWPWACACCSSMPATGS